LITITIISNFHSQLRCLYHCHLER